MFRLSLSICSLSLISDSFLGLKAITGSVCGVEPESNIEEDWNLKNEIKK